MDNLLNLKYQQMTDLQKLEFVEEQKEYLIGVSPQHCERLGNEELVNLIKRSNIVAESIGLTMPQAFFYLCFLSLTTGEELLKNEEFTNGIKNDEENPDACVIGIMDEM